jgi:hypothetical protein
MGQANLKTVLRARCIQPVVVRVEIGVGNCFRRLSRSARIGFGSKTECLGKSQEEQRPTVILRRAKRSLAVPLKAAAIDDRGRYVFSWADMIEQ